MVKNEGPVERGIRGVLGAALVLYALFGATNNMVLLVVLLIVGVVLIITAAIGFCPIWKVLGINTNKKV